MSGVRAQLESVFRAQRAALTAGLTRVFGPSNLDAIEAALQDAFVAAAETWPAEGVPERPDAWLLTVARRRVLDALRRAKRSRDNEQAVEYALREAADGAPALPVRLTEELGDDELQMMFVACHPCNSVESQIALTLRSLCGMEVDEIARALLSDTQATAKRLVRARQRLREENVGFELPAAAELERRLSAVMKVIYLLFNEGYSSLRGERQIREELCQEAIRLGEVLARHARTATPDVHALLALLLLQSSRLAARTDAQCALLTLAEQDRSVWDSAQIGRGMQYLARSAIGSELSEYHLEAGIAACHATAARFEDTDWARIVQYYDALVSAFPSPITAFNRAVALGFAQNPSAARAELESLQCEPALAAYFPFHAAIAEFEQREGHVAAARAAYARARELAGTAPERAFIERRLERLRS